VATEINSIGLIELSSVATGLLAEDRMLKKMPPFMTPKKGTSILEPL